MCAFLDMLVFQSELLLLCSLPDEFCLQNFSFSIPVEFQLLELSAMACKSLFRLLWRMPSRGDRRRNRGQVQMLTQVLPAHMNRRVAGGALRVVRAEGSRMDERGECNSNIQIEPGARPLRSCFMFSVVVLWQAYKHLATPLFKLVSI